MSRTNPSKKKRRYIKETILLYCEGQHEEVFVKYLKNLYARNSGVSVKTKNNHGGGANEVLRGALKYSANGGYDRKFCIVDTDTGIDASLEKKVHSAGIILIKNTPCFESLLLRILGRDDFAGKSNDKCKKEFQSKYVGKGKRANWRNYEKFFPKKLLEQKQKEILNLKIIISAMKKQS